MIPHLVFASPEAQLQYLTNVLDKGMTDAGLSRFEKYLVTSPSFDVIKMGDVVRMVVFDHLTTHGFAEVNIQLLIEHVSDDTLSGIITKICLATPSLLRADISIAIVNAIFDTWNAQAPTEQ